MSIERGSGTSTYYVGPGDTFGNEYLGLAEGVINNKSSSVINATVGDTFMAIGDVARYLALLSSPPPVNIDGFTQPQDLLPRIGIPATSGQPSVGVVVGGNLKGIYGDGIEPPSVSAGIEQGTVAGIFGDSVKVCTQGLCIAKVISRLGNALPIGTALTPDRGGTVSVPEGNFGSFKEAESGDFVLARLLQPVPLGTDVDTKVRLVAVNIQREGILP